MKMKKAIIIFGAIIFASVTLNSCGSKSSSSYGSQASYQHTCGNCSKGFNGGGYIKDRGGEVMSVSGSEIESFPSHYCSKSCAL